jgi:hypothetical protein
MFTSVGRIAAVLGAVLFACAARRATAAVLDPRFGAAVEFQNLGTTFYEGQYSAGGSTATGPGGAVVAEGGAGFSNSPPSHVNTTSIPAAASSPAPTSSTGSTFSVAGGGSADVPRPYGGNWNGAGGAVVRFDCSSAPRSYAVARSPPGYAESNVNGAPARVHSPIDSGDFVTGVRGRMRSTPG